jgi:hypothetical protein
MDNIRKRDCEFLCETLWDEWTEPELLPESLEEVEDFVNEDPWFVIHELIELLRGFFN